MSVTRNEALLRMALVDLLAAEGGEPPKGAAREHEAVWANAQAAIMLAPRSPLEDLLRASAAVVDVGTEAFLGDFDRLVLDDPADEPSSEALLAAAIGDLGGALAAYIGPVVAKFTAPVGLDLESDAR